MLGKKGCLRLSMSGLLKAAFLKPEQKAVIWSCNYLSLWLRRLLVRLVVELVAASWLESV